MKPARLKVRVRPRASSSRVAGWRDDGVLLIDVCAPPEGGRANKELISLLASALGLRKGALSICSGFKGREKVIEITGIDPDDLPRLLSHG